MRFIFPNSIQYDTQKYNYVFFLVVCLFILIISPITPAQRVRIDEVKGSSSPKQKRSKGLEMLNTIKKHIKRRYYDPKYKGIDIDKKFSDAKKKIKKMEHNWQIFREIAQLMLEFNDSHTRFYPPARSTRVDYGFKMQMIGQTCFVTFVKKKSDAEKKGLKPGFIIKSIGQFTPSRQGLWKIEYLINSLDPVKTIPLTAIDLDGKSQKLLIDAKFITLKERKETAKKNRKTKKTKKTTKSTQEKKNNPKLDYKCQEINPEVIACKLKTFSTKKKQIKDMMKRVNKHKKFILDLRGNGGGLVKIEKYLTGFFFNQKVKIGDFITRYEKEERFANPMGDAVFKGRLIVLIDSRSASASEVFARTIQIEERGRIIGDVSAGAVMTSNFLRLSVARGIPGRERITPYSLNLTIGDLIMSDGKRLEHVGVIPEVLIGPNSKALAERKDPVLAYAAQSFGADVDDAQTGKYGFLY